MHIKVKLSSFFIPIVNLMPLEQPYEKDDKVPIVGPSSYKEHGFRMLMIWAAGLNPDVPLVKELCDALSAVDKKTIAGNLPFLLLLCYLNKLSAIMQYKYFLFTKITMDYSGTSDALAKITIINVNVFKI